jgi:sterol desaturase/sphingolipid hydroxylase (fatty acid hydroxylase superfamily)
LARFVAIPALLVIAGVITYVVIREGWDFDATIAGILILVLAYLHTLERIIPLKPAWQSRRDELNPDIPHFISASLSSALGKFVSLSLVLHLHDRMNMDVSFWREMPFIPAFVIANLIGEFIPYWYHRISHVADKRSPLSMFLWRIHAIHHIPPKLNWLKTNWMHPVNLFLNTFTKLFPLQFLGFSKEIVFAVGIANIVVAYVSHANVSTRTGFLDYVIATPRVHHFHHSMKMEEAKNYANILPFWDLVFGTYFNNGRAVDEVGVVASTEDEYPKLDRFWRQMQFPFK